MSMVALATQARHFGLMSAMAQSVSDENGDLAPTDYRALVCVFLSGGNDANNMVVPKHNSTTGGISNYAAYTTARGTQGLALSPAQLLGINVPRIGNLEYGLHHNLGTMVGRTDIADNAGVLGGTRNGGIHGLWAAGKLAIIPNIGNLVAPMTRAQWQANSVPRPYALGDHDNQSLQQQSAQARRKAYIGWGGKIADFRDTPDNPGALVPMISSIAGAQLFTKGQTTRPLTLPNGNTSLANALVLDGYGANPNGIAQARRNGLNQLRAVDMNRELIAAANNITSEAVAASSALSTNPQEVTVTFPTTNIGNQFKQVARMIKKRTDLNIKRQIFFVSIGGFDTHENQISSVTGGQNGLFIQLGQAMRAFYEEMGAQNISNGVTTFTISDFGRTFNPASSGATVGSDHAWGSHALVMGGSVRGGNFHGINTSNGTPFQTLLNDGPDDMDRGSGARGRWIPTTSIDQYAATLSEWYGVPPWSTAPDNQMAIVLPNLENYPTKNLGFMNP